jgi:hypothetical protein
MSCKRKQKRSKVQEFVYRVTINVEHEMYDYTGNSLCHRNSNKQFKEKFGSHTIEIFNRLTTKDSYIRRITHDTEITAVSNFKPVRWGPPLIQEKYRGEKAYDKRHNNNSNNTRRNINTCRPYELRRELLIIFFHGAERRDVVVNFAAL